MSISENSLLESESLRKTTKQDIPLAKTRYLNLRWLGISFYEQNWMFYCMRRETLIVCNRSLEFFHNSLLILHTSEVTSLTVTMKPDFDH